MIRCDMCVISAKRDRLPDEIIPDTAEDSRADPEEKLPAAHAIDLDLESDSLIQDGSDGKIWLKVKLAQLYCIHQVITFRYNGRPSRTWTCSNTDCSTCEGDSLCSTFSLTTSIERPSSDDLPLIPDCKYGDTVTLERVNGGSFWVSEIAVTSKQGAIRYL